MKAIEDYNLTQLERNCLVILSEDIVRTTREIMSLLPLILLADVWKAPQYPSVNYALCCLVKHELVACVPDFGWKLTEDGKQLLNTQSQGEQL